MSDLDTTPRRYGCVAAECPFMDVLPPPDKEIPEADRALLCYVYSLLGVSDPMEQARRRGSGYVALSYFNLLPGLPSVH